MTICVGAISVNVKARERYAVVASDRMVTLNLPSIEFEQKVSKTIEITPNCVVSTAGFALAFSDILNKTRRTLDVLITREISTIVEALRQAYVEVRNQKMEGSILSRIGLTLKEFHERVNLYLTILSEWFLTQWQSSITV